MKNKRFKMLFAVGVILSIFSFTACGSTGEENKSNSESEQMQETEEEKKGFFDASYTTETTIAYSAGNDSDWSYGNQRKEFPIDDACYVRIASTAITDKNKGVENEIAVTYRFTGTENCQVNLTDGIAERYRRCKCDRVYKDNFCKEIQRIRRGHYYFPVCSDGERREYYA